MISRELKKARIAPENRRSEFDTTSKVLRFLTKYKRIAQNMPKIMAIHHF
jgi:predicted transcriptional regulator